MASLLLAWTTLLSLCVPKLLVGFLLVRHDLLLNRRRGDENVLSAGDVALRGVEVLLLLLLEVPLDFNLATVLGLVFHNGKQLLALPLTLLHHRGGSAWSPYGRIQAVVLG